MPEPSPVVYERAILWVTHPALLWLRVGGMTVLERQLFTASRAGVKSIWIGSHQPASLPADLRWPAGLEVRWVPTGAGLLIECAPPYLGLSGDHFVRPTTLAHVARTRYDESIAFEDSAGLGVIRVALTRDETISRHKLRLPASSYRRLESPLAGEETLDWLMAAGPKSGDGFMARHFDRHISLALSRHLLDTSVTPNAMTIASTLLGLIGSACFLGAARACAVSGALLVWFHSVLDGCDGELARVRFQETRFGANLDFWGDNLVHLALFTCLGIGFCGVRGAHTLVLAAVADLAVIGAAWTAWQDRRSLRLADAGAGSRLRRVETALAQRDFIYLLVLLAFLDRVYEFLWAAAIGSVLYFGIMLFLRRDTDHDSAPQPRSAG